MIIKNCLGRQSHWILTAFMAILLTEIFCSVARSDVTPAIGELRSMSTTVAQKVARHLQEKKKAIQVKIGAFTSIPADQANTGGLLANEFKLAFGSSINDKATTIVFGTYTSETFQDKDGVDKTRVKVSVRLLDETNGRELAEFTPIETTLINATNTAQLQGKTAVLPNNGALPVKNKHEPFIGGTQVKAFQDSPYAVEILKRPMNSKEKLTTVEPELDNGQPFVPLFKGEIVQVRVLNYSSKQIGVSMKLDGVDQFALSKVTKPLLDHTGEPLFDIKGRPLMGPKYRAYIVEPSKNGVPGETILTGWHIDNQTSEEFEQVALGKGVRSLFPELVNGPVGVITVGISNTMVSDMQQPNRLAYARPMNQLPGRELPPEPNFNIAPPNYGSEPPRVGSAPREIFRQNRRPPPVASRAPESQAKSRSSESNVPKLSPTAPRGTAPSQPPTKEPSEFGAGRKIENQVKGVDLIIEDPNTVITVRYHR